MNVTIIIKGGGPGAVSKILCSLTGCPVFESKYINSGCWVDYKTITEARRALKDCANKLKKDSPDLLSCEKKYNCISFDGTTATIYKKLDTVDKYNFLHNLK